MNKAAKVVLLVGLAVAFVALAGYAVLPMAMNHSSIMMEQAGADCLAHCLAAAHAPDAVPLVATRLLSAVLVLLTVVATFRLAAAGSVMSPRFVYARPSPNLVALHANYLE